MAGGVDGLGGIDDGDSDEYADDDGPGRERRGFPSRRAVLTGLAGSAACVLCGFAAGRVTAPGPGSAIDKLLERPRQRTRNNFHRFDVQPNAIFGVTTTEKVVALSFDDGPDIRYTGGLLELLAFRRLQVTFFQIGVNALAFPELTMAAHHAGHTIGNHTRDHADLDLLSARQVMEEIRGGEEDLMKAGAPRPTLFRPPKGLTDEIVGVFADDRHYRTVFWSLALEHFIIGHPIEAGVRAMLALVRPGDILLAHDGGHVMGVPNRAVLSRQRSMDAIPLLLDGLEQMGYRVLDVPHLLEVGPPRTRRMLRPS